MLRLLIFSLLLIAPPLLAADALDLSHSISPLNQQGIAPNSLSVPNPELGDGSILTAALLDSWCAETIAKRDATALACPAYLQGWLDAEARLAELYRLPKSCMPADTTPLRLAKIYRAAYARQRDMATMPAPAMVFDAFLPYLCQEVKP